MDDNIILDSVCGISYYKPKVTLLKESGIGVSEVAGRVCYDSFHLSENEQIRNFPTAIANNVYNGDADCIDSSELLDRLSWVNHHHSILEHTTLSFLVEGTSRGVLQEHARHRIQALSVRSTRYNYSDIAYAFASVFATDTVERNATIDKKRNDFIEIMIENTDMLVLADTDMKRIEFYSIFEKLLFQKNQLAKTGDDIMTHLIAKSSLEILSNNTSSSPYDVFMKLKAGKKKRNGGDPFKHTVTDNWKTDFVTTFNLRSLKNYFDLRTSGSAWFQMQWLAKEIKKKTPQKYLALISKEYRN